MKTFLVVDDEPLLEAHGGSIDVESAPGQGATFRFRIPLATVGASRTG